MVDDDQPRRFDYDPVKNDTSPWTEVDLSRLQAEDGDQVPVRLFVARFKSSSIDSENFIHDPVAVLAASGIDAFEGIDRTWRVTTLVINHEATLSVSHTVSSALVQGKSVGLTLAKVPPK